MVSNLKWSSYWEYIEAKNDTLIIILHTFFKKLLCNKFTTTTDQVSVQAK